MFSVMIPVLYRSAHIRLAIAAPLGSSFSSRAALLVDEILIRSIPFKCLSRYSSHCPKALTLDRFQQGGDKPVDVNISVPPLVQDISLVAHVAPEQTLVHKPSNSH